MAMKNGKGDIQRKALVPDKEVDNNWFNTFFLECMMCGKAAPKSTAVYYMNNKWIGACCSDLESLEED